MHAVSFHRRRRQRPVQTKMNHLVSVWAHFVNSQLPFVAVTDRHVAVPHSSERFGDWLKASSPLWALEGSNIGIGTPVMIQEGYVRPRS